MALPHLLCDRIYDYCIRTHVCLSAVRISTRTRSSLSHLEGSHLLRSQSEVRDAGAASPKCAAAEYEAAWRPLTWRYLVVTLAAVVSIPLFLFAV